MGIFRDDYWLFCLFVITVMFSLITMMLPGFVSAGPWWQSSINVESKVGTDRSIQSLDVMYPLSHSEDSLLFTDLRGRIDGDDSVELNLGLAHRFTAGNPLAGIPGVESSEEAVVGYYGFADRLESEFDNTFYQGTIGAEYFTKNYSLRINGYLPEDERAETVLSNEVRSTGIQIFFEQVQNYERPLPGYDAELGRTFRFDGWQLYGRGSYFRFHHSDATEVEGSRFRTGVQFNGSHPEVFLPEDSQLTLGVEWQEDNVRDEQTFGVFRVSMPFGSTVESRKSKVESQDVRPSTSDVGLKSWQQDRLTERVERDVDIVTGEAEETVPGGTEPAVLASTGESLDDVAVAENGATGSGRVSDPADLSSALDAAGTDGTVFVVDTGGTFTRTSSAVVKGGQSLIGGGAPLVLETPDGDARSVFRFGGGRPSIVRTDSGPTLRLRTGTDGQLLRGLRVRTEGSMAGPSISLRSVDNANVTVRDLIVEAPNSYGVLVDNPRGDWTLANSTVKSAEDAVAFTNNSGHVAVRDVTISSENSRGLYVTQGTATVRNVDVEKSPAADGGIQLQSLSGGNLHDISVGEDANGILVANSTSVSGDSLALEDHGLILSGSEDLQFRNLEVSNPQTEGGLLVLNSDTVSVTDFRIEKPSTAGVAVAFQRTSATNRNHHFEGTVTGLSGDTAVLGLVGIPQGNPYTYEGASGTIEFSGTSPLCVSSDDLDSVPGMTLSLVAEDGDRWQLDPGASNVDSCVEQ